MHNFDIRDEISIDAISQDQMNGLADSIEDYVSTVNDIFIMPKDLYDPKSKRTKEAMKIVEELVHQLRCGNKDAVFKDESY